MNLRKQGISLLLKETLRNNFRELRDLSIMKKGEKVKFSGIHCKGTCFPSPGRHLTTGTHNE